MHPIARASPVLATILVVGLLPFLQAGEPPASRVRYTALDPETAAVPLPAGKRVPAGWPAFSVGSAPVRLRVPAALPIDRTAHFRLTTALDDRQPRLIEVTLGNTGAVVGRMDLRYAHAIETFQLAIPDHLLREVRTQGLAVRLTGGGPPMWFFDNPAAPNAPASDSPALPLEFRPHLMTAPAGVDRVAEFHRRFASLASLQTFGWMEGCVLEGLRALGERQPGTLYQNARDAHWRVFVPGRDKLIYEDPRSEPRDGRVYGIEGGLPFADLARRDPTSPLIDLLVHFAKSRLRADGAIQDGGTLSAEGSYTIAYPLAVIAAVRNDPELARLAERQLQLRAERLWADGAIWLRRDDANRRTFRGWSRGVAWHVLGVAHAIEPLRTHGATAEVEAELRRAAAWLLPLQRPDGLWSCFVEDPSTPPDTSGSSGIAAALARGARLGVLDAAAGAAARRALPAVQAHLTPDGLLGGVAQSNRGGEGLQRSDYRVLGQIGLGLLALLIAEHQN